MDKCDETWLRLHRESLGLTPPANQKCGTLPYEGREYSDSFEPYTAVRNPLPYPPMTDSEKERSEHPQYDGYRFRAEKILSKLDAEIEPQLRTFDTGATRSPLGDKLQYEGYLNPLVLKRFAEYMKKHQTQSDGQTRSADNWQNNIPLNSLMDSGTRHFMDWRLYHRGYESEMEEPIEEALCAVMFNCMGYLKQMLELNGRGAKDD